MNSQEGINGTSEPNFVAFRAAKQDYCVDIMNVREIRRWTQTTALPDSPSYVNGVINLRGSVVPILDFSNRLGMQSSEPTERNVIVIVQVGDRTLGLLVDEVLEILNIMEDAIKPARNMSPEGSESLVASIILLDERMIRLVDLDLMLREPSAEEV